MIVIKSFGYGHPEGAPDAHMMFDLRLLFKDPHVSPDMRQLTGTDPRVIRSVMTQPGAEVFLQAIVDAVLATKSPDLVVAFGCVGGRHRSVVFADALYLELLARYRSRPLYRRGRGVPTVQHRDIGKAVLVR